MGGGGQVGPGESLLIVGPSGCGKSSLLRAISGTSFPCMFPVLMRVSPLAPGVLFRWLAIITLPRCGAVVGKIGQSVGWPARCTQAWKGRETVSRWATVSASWVLGEASHLGRRPLRHPAMVLSVHSGLQDIRRVDCQRRRISGHANCIFYWTAGCRMRVSGKLWWGVQGCGRRGGAQSAPPAAPCSSFRSSRSCRLGPSDSSCCSRRVSLP